jgi:hypothetical protein
VYVGLNEVWAINLLPKPVLGSIYTVLALKHYREGDN